MPICIWLMHVFRFECNVRCYTCIWLPCANAPSSANNRLVHEQWASQFHSFLYCVQPNLSPSTMSRLSIVDCGNNTQDHAVQFWLYSILPSPTNPNKYYRNKNKSVRPIYWKNITSKYQASLHFDCFFSVRLCSESIKILSHSNQLVSFTASFGIFPVVASQSINYSRDS